ncbi:metal-dependent hydrolase [Aquisalibacillus elongatus]|uniref:Inner membrane protein n=1 Tax=Aquisalibacillus elongatus TaxID=485577 RepID=A0A3N5AZW5_9BACI|nr:metal-dependent hydrolase [Aquisalibacillus elongatus]RPF50547.1 inner membrane protein [Aquisalibacillus elongatus]
MDTATHITMGVAVGGLATIDPAVQQDPSLFQAVLIGAIVGSHAPDFDTLFKLKDNATYIRHHRGASHSPIAVLMWSLLVSGSIYLFYMDVSYLHLWLWILFAVFLHVFVDIFNAYGTQALKPFKDKWIAIGFINTFDPLIFTLYIAGIYAWTLGADPRYTFGIVFFVVFLYYIKRYMDKREMVNQIQDYLPDVEKVVTQPTIRHNIWRIAVVTKDHFYVARSENGHIRIQDKFDRKKLPDSAEMNAALQDKNVRSFINFSPVYRYEIERFDDYIEIRFIDLRYRAKDRYPFVAVVAMDRFYNIITSYTGWVYSEDKLQKKLEPLN